MKNIDKIPNLLPLGYIFLVVLGIIKESVYYYQIGINIIRYSSIMDILISPIAALTSHPVFTIVIIILLIFCYNAPQMLLKYEDKKWLQNFFITDKERVKISTLSQIEKREYYSTAAIKSVGVFMSCLFLGYGLADGKFVSDKIKNNKLSYDYKLNYMDDKSEDVSLIGSNTAYFFYLTKGNKTVKIAPVAAVKNIELLKNRMLDN